MDIIGMLFYLGNFFFGVIIPQNQRIIIWACNEVFTVWRDI